MARKSRYAAEAAPAPVSEFLYDTAGYVRRSDEDRGEAASLENQAIMVRKYIERTPGLRLREIYSDNGQTGTNFQRPGFEDLMDGIRRGKINCIVVKDLSRFGRDYIEAGNYLETIFPRLGVRFISIGDNYDSFDPRCRGEGLSIALKNMINAFYAKDISVKTRSAFAAKQRKGEYTGGMPPFGYLISSEDRHKLVIDEKAAAVVRDIFRWRLEGLRPADIARRLEASGFPSPGHYFYVTGIFKSKHFEKNRRWADSTVRNMLENPVYIGDMALGKTRVNPNQMYDNIHQPRDKWVITKGTHEPIVSEADFEAVQALVRQAKATHWRDGETPEARRANSPENIFSGLIFCADCGRVFRRVQYKTQAGKVYKYCCVECTTETQGGVKRKYLTEAVLHEIVHAIIMGQVEAYGETRRQIEKAHASGPVATERDNIQIEIRKLRVRLDALDAKTMRAYDDLCDGILSDIDYRMIKGSYETERAENLARIDELESSLARLQPGFVDENPSIIEFEKFSGVKGLSRDMLTALVERIVVNSDLSVEVFFRYEDEYAPLLAFIKENGDMENE